jgi:signal transduction histidine kinase
MQTYFASPERATPENLRATVDDLNRNPLMGGLMQVTRGLLAVLNEHRQVLAVNESFLQMLGIRDPEAVLGLRPGEVVGCVRAKDAPSGCGTAEACATCGAAIAIVTGLNEDRPTEQTCAITVQRDGTTADLFLKVRAQPLTSAGRRYLLLFMQDYSEEQQRALIHRVFFHDLNNMIGAVLGQSEMLIRGHADSRELAWNIRRSSLRLAQEIVIQRYLSAPGQSGYDLQLEPVSGAQVLSELWRVYEHHPAAADKVLQMPVAPEVFFKTDLALLLRVLCNMVTNALEATPARGVVRLAAYTDARTVAFAVWNAAAIPPAVAARIFQRNFSTRASLGRGLGSYSMKMLGEQVLHGRVGFSTSAEEGTEFRITLDRQ